MRKYVKPELFYESFELSQQIAACDYDLVEGTFEDQGCIFTGTNKDFLKEMTIFLAEGSCKATDTKPADVLTESYCYHSSTTGYYSIFNS